MVTKFWAEARRRDRLLFVVAAGWVLVLYAAFQPGLMSVDSVLQYQQGITGRYNNWHPPFVSLLNGLAGRLAGSPWPLLVAQLSLLAAGMCLLARAAPPQSAPFSLAVLAAFFLLPPVWSIAVTLWKDVLMAVALLWAVVDLRVRRPARSFAWMIVAVLCRHNAIFAAVPLAVYAAALSAPRAAGRAALVAVQLVALAIAPRIVDRLLHAEDRFIAGALLLFDEMAIYADHPEALKASPFSREYTAQDVARVHMVQSCVPIFHGGPEARRFPESSLPARRPEISREWLRLLRAYPGTYVRERVSHFLSLISIGWPACYPFQIGISPNNWGFHLQEGGAVLRALRRFQDATASTWLFLGWPWLMLLLAIGAWAAMRHGARSLALWTTLSGLAYAGGYLAVGVVCDFRYLYWSVIAVFAAVELLLSESGRRAST